MNDLKHPREDTDADGKCRFAARSIAWAAFGTALLGGLVTAFAEFSFNLLSVRVTGAPARIVLGALARCIHVHFFVWSTLALVLIPILALLFRMRPCRQIVRTPVVATTALFVSAMTLVIVPRLPSMRAAMLSSVITALLGLGSLFCMRWAAGKFNSPRCCKFARRAVASCLLLWIAAWFYLQGSPAAGATQYVVPQTVQAADVAQAPSPNLVFVVLDTVRADHLSTYGYERQTSPFLDRLAKEATVFDLAISPAVWTVPAHASMFTGLSVREHKANWDNLWLGDQFKTLAETLLDREYQTVSLSNNPFPGRTNLLQGFQDQYPMWSTARISGTFVDFYLRRFGIAPPFRCLETDAGAAATNCCIADWLDRRRNPNKSFFMFVNYMEAHVVYWPPRKYRCMFMDEDDVDRSYALLREHPNMHRFITRELTLRDSTLLGERDREILRSLYDAAIRYQDDRLAELYRMFSERDLLENTMLIVVSDHGEPLGEHNNWDHQWSVHNTLLHVPLVIRHPPFFESRRVSRTVSTTDLFHLAMEICGAGKDSTGRLTPDPSRRSAPLSDDVVVSEYLAPYRAALRWGEKNVPAFDHRRFSRSFRSIIINREKLIVSNDATKELFDLLADPGERTPLILNRPESARILSTSLRSWLERTPEYTPPDKPNNPPTAAERDAIRRLHGLGYVGD